MVYGGTWSKRTGSIMVRKGGKILRKPLSDLASSPQSHRLPSVFIPLKALISSSQPPLQHHLSGHCSLLERVLPPHTMISHSRHSFTAASGSVRASLIQTSQIPNAPKPESSEPGIGAMPRSHRCSHSDRDRRNFVPQWLAVQNLVP